MWKVFNKTPLLANLPVSTEKLPAAKVGIHFWDTLHLLQGSHLPFLEGLHTYLHTS